MFIPKKGKYLLLLLMSLICLSGCGKIAGKIVDETDPELSAKINLVRSTTVQGRDFTYGELFDATLENIKWEIDPQWGKDLDRLPTEYIRALLVSGTPKEAILPYVTDADFTIVFRYIPPDPNIQPPDGPGVDIEGFYTFDGHSDNITFSGSALINSLSNAYIQTK